MQVVLVALVVSSRRLGTRFSIPAASLNLVASLVIVALAHAEHVKSVRPSFLLTAYLLGTLLFDAARLRTEWLVGASPAHAGVLSAATALKLVLLALETVEKRRILIGDSTPSVESTSGPLNRGFFVWLNPLLLTGWSTALDNNRLPPIHEKVSSERLAARFAERWEKATKTSKKPSLFLVVASVLKWELLSIAVPRLAAIALSISQPFLITQAMRFLTESAEESSSLHRRLEASDINHGYGLIGAFALVFISSAVVVAWYEHLTFRVGSQVRGGLITLIYSKMLKMPTADLSESSAVALMGNDVETLAELIKSLLVEFWANALTVGIATWLLANQLGAVCIAPILVGILALLMTGALGGPMYRRQTLYQEATQDRINFTTEVLSSIKAVKMLGYTERFSTLIDQKREEDIRAGKYYRRLSVLINAIVNGNIAFAEVATFGSFAVVAKISGSASFSVTQAVTALSILTVLLMPLCDLLISIMSSFQVFGCFRRFEDFLLREEQTDNRVLDRREDSKTSLSKSPNDKAVVTEDVELESMACKKSSPHLSIVDAGFNWGENDVLEKIGISLAPSQNGSLTIVVGPIGSGKSTLLKGILGETKSSSGVVALANADIAYCSQTPWIMNATLRDNIVAQSGAYDEEWFETVVNACNLTTDFARFPSADLTVVGDNGLKLSGGQRQRLVSRLTLMSILYIANAYRLLLVLFTRGGPWPSLMTSLAASIRSPSKSYSPECLERTVCSAETIP
jgi:ATP-binding cassette subfamily C (CFTR/MRP) protein 1